MTRTCTEGLTCRHWELVGKGHGDWMNHLSIKLLSKSWEKWKKHLFQKGLWSFNEEVLSGSLRITDATATSALTS